MIKVGDYMKMASGTHVGPNNVLGKVTSIDLGKPYPIFVEWLDHYETNNSVFAISELVTLSEEESALMAMGSQTC